MDNSTDRGLFDRIAERTSTIVGQAGFFMASVGIVLLWVPMILVIHSVDTWQLVLSTLTSAAAFLLIALLQNSERRNDRAIHQKLDALAAAMAAQMRERENGQAARELEASVKVEERL